MKNSINLYQEELKPLKESLKLSMMLSILAVSLVVMASIIGGIVWQGKQLEVKRTVAFSERTKAQESLSALAAMKQNLQPDQQLELAVASMRQQYMNFNRFLKKLSQDKVAKSARFNQVMTDLADIDIDDIWLTEITLDGDLLSLQGMSVKESSIPVWLERFEQKSGLANRTFAKVSMKRTDQKVIQFTLRSNKTKN